jgi:hypothetical protein
MVIARAVLIDSLVLLERIACRSAVPGAIAAGTPLLQKKALGIVYRTIATHLTRKAGYTKTTAHTGAVTLIQRFGGALKDPESGNLDRIQIIKGFINKWGRTAEKIYNVAWSDNRKLDPKTGKLPPVGNSVDVKTAKYTNDIGDSQLSAVWTDPHFDPKQKAVYYVRVLEIPTPRWSTYDSVKSGLPIPDGVPATIQERAWSSPIWYTPESMKTAKK